jgi:hypothetical protein
MEEVAKRNNDFFNSFLPKNSTVTSLKHKIDPIRRGFSKYVVTPVKKVGRKIRTGAESIYQNTKSYSKGGFEKVKKASKSIKKSAGSGWKKFKDRTDLDLLELNIRDTDWPAYRARKWEEFKTGTGENWKTLKAKARQFPGKVYDEAEDIGQRLGELKENVSKRISSWRQKREDRRIAIHNEQEQIKRGALKRSEEVLQKPLVSSLKGSHGHEIGNLDNSLNPVFGQPSNMFNRFKAVKRRSKAVKNPYNSKVKKSNMKTKRK